MYTVKQAAETLKIPPASLRYYDRLGIVSPMRAENGYRYYSEENLRALRYMSIMKYAHFSLPEIKIIMDRFQSCENESGDECNAICQRVFLARLAALRDSVANLQRYCCLRIYNKFWLACPVPSPDYTPESGAMDGTSDKIPVPPLEYRNTVWYRSFLDALARCRRRVEYPLPSLVAALLD